MKKKKNLYQKVSQHMKSHRITPYRQVYQHAKHAPFMKNENLVNNGI